MIAEVIECCPHCDHENVLVRDVEKDGYVAVCKNCGEKIMLCSECMRADDNPNRYCDWDEIAGCFRERR